MSELVALYGSNGAKRWYGDYQAKMTTTLWRLQKNAANWPRMAELKPLLNVNGETGRIAMNKGYFDVILVSLIVASCYMFVVPV